MTVTAVVRGDMGVSLFMGVLFIGVLFMGVV